MRIFKDFIHSVIHSVTTPPHLGGGWGVGLLLALLFSCSNIEEESEYENWEARNQLYINIVAEKAKAGEDGWKQVLAYHYTDTYAALNPDDNNAYVYMQQTKVGTGTVKPFFNDSVRFYYKGRLIPTDKNPDGKIFDKCFDGDEPNDSTDVPALFRLDGLTMGCTSALQEMVEGDQYTVVVPYSLGYGTTDQTNIPAYSTLIFDIKLKKIYKYGEDTTWH